MSSDHPGGTPRHNRRSRGNYLSVFHSPWIWGGLLTVAFYTAIPYLPIQKELTERYFCGHWIEYATAGLFFVGMTALLFRAIRLPTEHRALKRADWNFSPGDAESILRQIDEQLPSLTTRRPTLLALRLRDICDYVRGRGSADGLDEHVSYLAEIAADRLHASYALIRTVTWAVPILGFLGTVIGITIAVANVTPEQLDSSLTEVTGGLAVAFDTTALSLTLSLILVFATFVVERSERLMLDGVEDFSVRQIASWFPRVATPRAPLAEAESQAAAELLQRTRTLIEWQTNLWQESLETLRARWSETLQKQQACLDQALQSGLTETLADHAQQLREVRTEFLTAFQQATLGLAEQLAESRAAWQCQQEVYEERLTEQLGHWLASIQQQTTSWQSQLQDSTAAMAGQLGELRQQSSILLRILEQEEQLTRLQERLTQNLEAVRAADTFEETLQSLSAAVHLLSARSRKAA